MLGLPRLDVLRPGPNERARLAMTREQLEQLGAYDQNNLGQYGTRYGWGEGLRLYR